MGLHNKRHATQLPPRPDTWIETEERRRLWWASLMYDRVVTICFRFRPLAIPSIAPDEILPGSDSEWDRGEICVNSLLVMSIESQAQVSPFARTCQAAHLLGRVCQHVNEHADPGDVDFHYQEAHGIQRAGEALLTMLQQESTDSQYKLLTARALCCSALLSIYDTHCCIEIDPIEIPGRNKGMRLELQQLGLDGYKRMSAIISDLANEIRRTMVDHAVSPLVLHCLYVLCCIEAIRATGLSDDQSCEPADV